MKDIYTHILNNDFDFNCYEDFENLNIFRNALDIILTKFLNSQRVEYYKNFDVEKAYESFLTKLFFNGLNTNRSNKINLNETNDSQYYSDLNLVLGKMIQDLFNDIRLTNQTKKNLYFFLISKFDNRTTENDMLFDLMKIRFDRFIRQGLCVNMNDELNIDNDELEHKIINYKFVINIDEIINNANFIIDNANLSIPEISQYLSDEIYDKLCAGRASLKIKNNIFFFIRHILKDDLRIKDVNFKIDEMINSQKENNNFDDFDKSINSYDLAFGLSSMILELSKHKNIKIKTKRNIFMFLEKSFNKDNIFENNKIITCKRFCEKMNLDEAKFKKILLNKGYYNIDYKFMPSQLAIDNKRVFVTTYFMPEVLHNKKGILIDNNYLGNFYIQWNYKFLKNVMTRHYKKDEITYINRYRRPSSFKMLTERIKKLISIMLSYDLKHDEIDISEYHKNIYFWSDPRYYRNENYPREVLIEKHLQYEEFKYYENEIIEFIEYNLAYNTLLEDTKRIEIKDHLKAFNAYCKFYKNNYP